MLKPIEIVTPNRKESRFVHHDCEYQVVFPHADKNCYVEKYEIFKDGKLIVRENSLDLAVHAAKEILEDTF